MTFLFYLVVVLHVIACLFLIAVVLLQQGKGQDLASAFGGGGTQTAFGPRGSATVLSRATAILAGVFVVTSLALSIIPRGTGSGVLDQVAEPATAASPAAAPKATPAVPAAATTPSTAAPAPAEAAPGSGSLAGLEVVSSPAEPAAPARSPGVSRTAVRP